MVLINFPRQLPGLALAAHWDRIKRLLPADAIQGVEATTPASGKVVNLKFTGEASLRAILKNYPESRNDYSAKGEFMFKGNRDDATPCLMSFLYSFLKS